MRVTTGLALTAVAWVSAGCSGVPLRAGADYEPGYDFAQYTSFTWDDPDPRPTGDPRLDSNPFFVHRLHAAIHWELSMRGIVEHASGPALSVHHHVSVRDRVEVFEADRAAGYTSEYGEGTQVIQYEEGPSSSTSPTRARTRCSGAGGRSSTSRGRSTTPTS